MDASNDLWNRGIFQKTLTPEHPDKIVTTYRDFIDVEGYCRVCSLAEVEKNGFLLDVGRYVKTKRVIVPKVDLRVSLTKLDLVHRVQVNEYERIRVKPDEIVEYLEAMDQVR